MKCLFGAALIRFNFVAFSPDGRMIASGSGYYTIKLWNAQTGSLIRTLKGHSSWVNSVAFSPDGRMLASGSADKTIKLWSIKKLKNEIALRKEAENEVMNIHSIEQGKQYITKYEKYRDLKKSATNKIFKMTPSTIEELEKFIGNYGVYSDLKKQAITQIYELTKKIDAVEGYRYFLQKYPYASEAKQASDRLYEIMYAITEEENTILAYHGFLNNFGKSPKVYREKAMKNSILLEAELSTSNLDELGNDDQAKEKIARKLYVEAIRAKEGGDNITYPQIQYGIVQPSF